MTMRKTKVHLDDEVERCRQVRRVLERTHGGLEGLCDWIEGLQRQQGKNRVTRGDKKPPSRRSKAR